MSELEQKRDKEEVVEQYAWVISLAIGVGASAIGWSLGENWLGMLALATAMIDAFLSGVGKIQAYFFGLTYSVILGIVAWQSGLFGNAVYALAVSVPLQIYGWWNWRKNLIKKDNNKRPDEVKMKKMTWKMGLIVVLGAIIISWGLGWGLSLIPNERVAMLDAFSVITNLLATILLTRRYREAWPIWIASAMVDVVIWAVSLNAGIVNAGAMLILSIGYLITDSYGWWNWRKGEVEERD